MVFPRKRRADDSVLCGQSSKRTMYAPGPVCRSVGDVHTELHQPPPAEDQTATDEDSKSKAHEEMLGKIHTLMLPHSRANIIQGRGGLATHSATFSNRDSRSNAHIRFRAAETTSLAIGHQSNRPTATTYPPILDMCTEVMPRSRSHEAMTRAKHDDLLKLRANMTACLINNATRGCTPFFVPLEDDGDRNLRSRLAHYHSKELEIIRSIRQSLEVDQQGWPQCASHVQLELGRLGREIEMDKELGCSPQDILLNNIRRLVNLVEEISARC